jgi:hypothetical protein
MAHVKSLLSRFHISTAMMLATVAFLAIPESAFADDPTKCAEACGPSGSITYWACIANCCNTDDPGDPKCCENLCDPSDPGCVAGCNNGLLMCCELSGSDPMNCPLSGRLCPGGCDTTSNGCLNCACIGPCPGTTLVCCCQP